MFKIELLIYTLHPSLIHLQCSNLSWWQFHPSIGWIRSPYATQNSSGSQFNSKLKLDFLPWPEKPFLIFPLSTSNSLSYFSPSCSPYSATTASSLFLECTSAVPFRAQLGRSICLEGSSPGVCAHSCSSCKSLFHPHHLIKAYSGHPIKYGSPCMSTLPHLLYYPIASIIFQCALYFAY